MRILQRLRALYFELAYSVLCENHIVDVLEGISTVLEFFQIAALILSPVYTQWNIPVVQNVLQIALLNFDSMELNYVAVSLVILMDLCFGLLLWQIAYKGGISLFRILVLARVLVGIMSTFLFLPLVEEAVKVAYQYAHTYSTGFGPSLTDVLVIGLVNVIGLTIPSFLIAFVQGPDHKEITLWSRVSSREQVFILVIKFIISFFSSIGAPNLFAWIMFFSLGAVLLMALYLPPYFSPIVNAVWIAQQAVLTYGALVLVVMVSVSDASSSTTSWFYVLIGGSLPAALLGAVAFKHRSNYVFDRIEIWSHDWRSLAASIRRSFLPRGQATALSKSEAHIRISVPLVDSTKQVGAGELLNRCKNATDVIFVANTLYATGGDQLSAYLLEFLARGAKRYPEHEQLYLCYISKAAVLGGISVQAKTHIQNLIRKAVTRTHAALDTRFQYYSVIKNFEITSFRLQGREMKKMKVLDIIRYHYNYTEATKNYISTLKWSHTFWRACSAEATRNAETLGYIADQLQEHQTAAIHHFHVLLERFPSSVAILRAYAAFVYDCINNERLGDEIIDCAQRLEEERAERGTFANGGKGPATTDASVITIERHDPTAEDGKSERSGTHQSSITGRSSDLMKSIATQSIFDVESYDELRNGVAMESVTSLARTSRFSFGLLFVAVVALYILGGTFSVEEIKLRNLISEAGVLRRSALVAVGDSRLLSFSLPSRNWTSIAAAQEVLRMSCLTLMNSMQSVYYRAGMTMTDYLITYWTWRKIPDRTFNTLADYLTPLELYNNVYLRGYDVALAPPNELSEEYPSLEWILQNGLSDQFFLSVLDTVDEFVNLYQSKVTMWLQTLEYSSWTVISLPVLAFIVLALPKWWRLNTELDTTTRLFSKIPRRIAGVLADEMKERYESKVDSEGAGETLRVGSGSSSGIDAPLIHMGKKQRSKLSYRVLYSYGISKIFVLMLLIAMSFSITLPLRYYSKRAALINYSGLRFSIVYRTMLGVRELQHIQRTVPATAREETMLANRAKYWKSSVFSSLDMLHTVHRAVLFGNSTYGLERTVGLLQDADILTFAPYCETLGQPRCLSFDDQIQYFSDLVKQAATAGNVTDVVMSEVNRISDLSGEFNLLQLQIREVYSKAQQGEIDAFGIAQTWLFIFTFPLYFGLFLWLRHVFALVRSRIKRTRNILFQLPTEIQAVIPSISSYLKSGRVQSQAQEDLSRKTMQQAASIFVRRASVASNSSKAALKALVAASTPPSDAPLPSSGRARHVSFSEASGSNKGGETATTIRSIIAQHGNPLTGQPPLSGTSGNRRESTFSVASAVTAHEEQPGHVNDLVQIPTEPKIHVASHLSDDQILPMPQPAKASLADRRTSSLSPSPSGQLAAGQEKGSTFSLAASNPQGTPPRSVETSNSSLDQGNAEGSESQRRFQERMLAFVNSVTPYNPSDPPEAPPIQNERGDDGPSNNASLNRRGKRDSLDQLRIPRMSRGDGVRADQE